MQPKAKIRRRRDQKEQPLPGKIREVEAILAKTDWSQYWREVAEKVEPEIEAYEMARARSLADAATKFFRGPVFQGDDGGGKSVAEPPTVVHELVSQ